MWHGCLLKYCDRKRLFLHVFAIFFCLLQYVHGIHFDNGKIDGCEVQSSKTLSLRL